MMRGTIPALAQGLLVMTSLGGSAVAQSGTDFAGKTVTILSSFASGGGYDTYARLYAMHVGRHISGQPVVIVRNMPGAGGLIGANYLYSVAPKDGTMLGVIPQNVATAQLLGSAGVKYDVARFNWVGRINSNVEVQQSWHSSAVKTIEDAKLHTVVAAGTGPDSSSVVFPRILNEMFGMKFKVVTGYEGVSMVTLAMERGEVETVARPWAITKTVHPDWLKDRKINLLVQYTVERHPELQHIPAVVDLAQNDSQRQILSLYASGSDIGRSIVAPPDLPAEIVNAARRAFDQTMKDQAFLDDIKRSDLDFDMISGERLQQIVNKIQNIDAAVIERAKQFSINRN